MTIRRVLSGILLVAALPLAAGSASMDGGAFSVPMLSSLSGGLSASGGAYSLYPVSMGGPSFSETAPSGGAYSLYIGAVPALVIADPASGSLGGVHCYPVPFRPSAGHTRITFTGLTRQAEVKIYTVSGVLVRTLSKNDLYGYMDWDARNSLGQRVASGVYIYTVKGGGQSARGKLMIIW